MIFVDSNIPMYLVGASHQHKERSLTLVTKLIRDEEVLVTDVEVTKSSCTDTWRSTDRMPLTKRLI